jgi:hypothetical protein
LNHLNRTLLLPLPNYRVSQPGGPEVDINCNNTVELCSPTINTVAITPGVAPGSVTPRPASSPGPPEPDLSDSIDPENISREPDPVPSPHNVCQPGGPEGVEKEEVEEEAVWLTAVQPRSDICMIRGFRPGLPVFVNYQPD